jgi:hypothetical protein
MREECACGLVELDPGEGMIDDMGMVADDTELIFGMKDFGVTTYDKQHQRKIL